MQLHKAIPAAVLLGSFLGATVVTIGPAISSDSHRNAPMLVGQALAAEPPVRWDIPVVRNEPVLRFVNLFTERQSDRMALYLKRSGRYEGMIRGKLRERGMPEDLLYLSMIESGFNPTARSKASAVGLWQFIADTGRRYGLRIDSYVDERRHPEKSTDAALRYLTDLHDEFGSWYLAAAAYNTGEGRVRRIMKEETGSARGTDADFWRIRDRLPSETREYVPLMVAAALIGEEPQKYGLEDVSRHLPDEVAEVTVPGGTALSAVARAAGVPAKEVERLNPHLIKEITPPGRDYAVRIPRERTAVFAAQWERVRAAEATRLAAARAAAEAASTTHVVRRGESLWTIARRNGTSVRAIQRANDLGGRTRIRPGQRLRIPG